MTTAFVVGATDSGVSGCLIVKTTSTNAMMARKIPMSRTSRLERFK
jgi:hypothetical protein